MRASLQRFCYGYATGHDIIGEYTKALESFEQSLQIMESLKNFAGKASTLTDMGVAYLGAMPHIQILHVI